MRAVLTSGGALQRLLHVYFRLARGLTLGVRAAAFDEVGRVCLVRHTYIKGWHLPGGGVEVGETALAALGRELAEEAPVALGPETSFHLHGVFFNTTASRRDHVLVYVVRGFQITGARAPDREIAEAGFFPPDALPADTARSTRARLEEIAGRAPLAEGW